MAAARALLFTTLVCGLLALAPNLQVTDAGGAPETVKIGMVQTLFADVSPTMMELADRPFRVLMKEQTGLNGKLCIGGDCYYVGKELQEGRLHLGVFNGVEFAWARLKYPDLRPLMVAINKEPYVQAHLVVKKDADVQKLDQLQGKPVAIPNHTKHHSRLFLDKLVSRFGKERDGKGFFSKIIRPPHYEKALDDVAQGEIPVTIVDKIALENYQAIKPGSFAVLRVINDSELFPAAVIAFRQNGPADSCLAKFRDGMINANKDTKAQRLMKMFNVDAFTPVPADYQNHLDTILRAYPPPEVPQP